MLKIKKLYAVVVDRGYDSKDNHLLIRHKHGEYSTISARNEHILV